MKLKLLNKPDKGTNRDPLIIHVEWGGGESSDGQRILKKKFISKVLVGQVIEVEDQLGYAIMSAYIGCWDIVSEKEPTVSEKRTKEITPPETK